MSDRCNVTELLTAECAHCRRIPDAIPPPERRATVTITAGWPGRCADCGDWFPEGASITADPDRHGWLADCCMKGDGHA